MRMLSAGCLALTCVFGISLVIATGADEKKKAEKPIEPEAVKLGRPVEFERDIYPILEQNCIACHNVAINESKLVLEEMKDILKGGKRGPAVVPKQPDKSLLYRVAARSVKPAMPPLPNNQDAAALTPRELGLLRQWILEGATGGAGRKHVVQFVPLPDSANAVYSVAVSPHARYAAAGRANQVHLFDIVAGEQVARLIDPKLSAIKFNDKLMYPGGAAHRDFVHSMAFNPAGTLLATGGYRVVKLWQRPSDVQRFKLTTPAGVTAVAINGDGTLAVVAAADNSLRLWNLKDGKPGKLLAGHTAAVGGVEFWPTAGEHVRVAAARSAAETALETAQQKAVDAAKAVKDFDPKKAKLDAEKEKAEREKLANAQAAAEKAITPAKEAAMKALAEQAAFAKKVSEQSLVVSGSQDKTVRVWKASDGSLLRKIDTPAPVNDVAFNSDGTRVISAHADNLIRVWTTAAPPKPEPKKDAKKKDAKKADAKKKDAAAKPAAEKPVLEIKGHTKPVTAVDLVQPAGTQVASGSEDGTVRIWDVNKGNQVRSINFGAPVTGVAVRPDGGALAATGANNIGRLWDLNGKQLAELKGAVNLQHKLVDLTEEQSVAKQLVGIADGEQKASDKTLKGRVETAKKSKTAKEAADKKVAEQQPKFKAANDKSVAATTAATNATKAAVTAKGTLDGATKKAADTKKAAADAAKAKVAADKLATDTTKTAATAKTASDVAAKKAADAATAATKAKADAAAAAKKLADAQAALKNAKDDAAKKKAQADVKTATDAKAKADTAAAAAAKTAADTKKAADDAAKKAADAKKKADEATKAKTAADTKAIDTTKVATVAETARKKADTDNKAAIVKVAATKKTKDDADKETAKQKGELKKQTDAQVATVRTLKLADKASADATTALAAANALKKSRDVYQKQIDPKVTAAQAADKAADKPMKSIAFSPDSKRLVTGGDDQLVHLWDARTGRAAETFAGHQGSIAAIAFGLDGVVVSGGADKLTVAWDTVSDWKLVGQLGPSKDAPMDVTESQFISRVLTVDFSRDGKWLVTGGGDPSRSGELMIWDVAKLTLVKEFKDAHSDTVFGAEFSRDGKFVVSGAADKFVKIFEIATGKHVKSFEGHTHHVLDVSWKADATSIASAGADNVIKVWNVKTGEQRRTIGGFSRQVTSLRYIGIGEDVVCCSGDKAVRYHKTGNGQKLKDFGGGTDFMYAAASARDQSYVIAGGQDGVIRIWNGGGTVLKTYMP